MGWTLLAASSSKSSSSPLTLLLPFILIIAVFYFLLMRPQRNRQRRIQETQNAIAPGQRIRTTAGMYGTVVAVEDDDLILEIAPDVEIRVLKRAVMDVLPGNVYSEDTEETADPEEAGEAHGTDGLLDAPADSSADGSAGGSADGSAPGAAHQDTPGHTGSTAEAGASPPADGSGAGETGAGEDREAEGTRAREK